MKATRALIALNVLLAAALACNMPGGQSPAQGPDLAGTITAQAMIILQSNGTPVPADAAIFTDTPAITDTPSATPTITLTPTPSVPEVNVTSATNCRTGPGTEYDLLYTLQPGQVAQIIGKDSADNYWIINYPGGTMCWLWGQYAVVSGNIAALAEYPVPPTPTLSLPANPSNLKVQVSCSLKHNGTLLIYNEVNVNLSWHDNATNEEGYYVFRNGDLLATLGANESSFSDSTTLPALVVQGNPAPSITYAVQAFNGAGKSNKVSKTVDCSD